MELQKMSTSARHKVFQDRMQQFARVENTEMFNELVKQCTGIKSDVKFADRMRVNLRTMSLNPAFKRSLEEVFGERPPKRLRRR